MTSEIAVVGMGCRFPGGIDSPEAYWRFLMDGGDAVTDAPTERWSGYAKAGPDFAGAVRRATEYGAFLDDIAGFDAEFFGVSPREAEVMDPQQRLLLEVAWEALEHAGLPPRSLAGTDTGVYIGVSADDYGRRLLEDLPTIDAWTGIGSGLCGIANRVSYLLDLRGSSLILDTACSASLVAIHLACRSLALGEDTLALAGGVNLIAAPGVTLSLDAAGATSPEGRSRPFAAEASGYGRGEGVGVVVLKRLDDALRDGDRVLAVVRGGAVRQDGRSGGIMSPNGSAQEHVLRQAYRNADVSPNSIDYVEAHGTGTAAGDPVEAGALSAFFARPADRPCLIGSVKSNIGHLEPAAGVAGVIKTVLALQHRTIPATLHCDTPQPDIDWANSGLRVVTRTTPWPDRDQPLRAGVSAFGYGGTVAHLIVEEPPEAPERSAEFSATAGGIFPVSGGSAAGMRGYAARLADWLDGAGSDVPLASVGHTLALRRSHLDHRATVVARTHEGLRAGLRALAAESAAPDVVTGMARTDRDAGDVVWVFSGHGAQWTGMGRGLLAREPAFATKIDELEPLFLEESGFSPRRAIVEGVAETIEAVQSLSFAIQIGVGAVLRHYGVRPAAVIGHSVGEVAAAVTAGALDLRSGVRLICRRARLLRRTVGQGAMAMVGLPFYEARQRLVERTDVVAAIDAAPNSTVISGDPEAVAAVADTWEQEGLFVRRVVAEVAFHSPQMDALRGDMAAELAELAPTRPDVRIYSTALADPRTTAPRDVLYWTANLRNHVRFVDAVRAAAEDGHRRFVEISAHPIVVHSLVETMATATADDPLVLGSLRRHEPERESLLETLGALHCDGVDIDWSRLAPGGELVSLPPVAWQHQRYWRDHVPSGGEGGGHDVDSHTLLGSPASVTGTTPMRFWRTRLDAETRPYPSSHSINGVEIVPASVLLNTFLNAAATGDDLPCLADVELRVPLPAESVRQVQVIEQDRVLRVVSRPGDAGEAEPWTVHTVATVAVDRPVASPPASDCDEALDPGTVLDHLAASGVPSTGFAWQVEELHRGDGGLLARVQLPELTHTWAPALDAALSIAPYAVPGEPTLRLIARIGTVSVTGASPARVVIRAVFAGDDTVDVVVADEDGRDLAVLTGVRYTQPGADQPVIHTPADRLVHELAWQPLDLAAPSPTPGRVVLVGATHLRPALEAAGATCLDLPAPDDLESLRVDLNADDSVVVAAEPDAGDAAGGAVRSAWRLTRAAQILTSWGSSVPGLWCVTVGGRDCRREADLAGAAMWGTCRVIAGEHAEVWGGVVDLSESFDDSDARCLTALLAARPDEDVLAVRGGTVDRARLVLVDRAPTEPAVECRSDGTYLITGGLGALGLEVARWLAGRGARRLVLAGRRAFPVRADWDSVTDPVTRESVAAIRGLEALGVTVRVVSLDIADRDQAAELLGGDLFGLPPIRGVVHAAGVLDNRMVADLDEASLATVLRPKAAGAMVLHELFPPGSLDFLVLFSSCGQLVRLTGQASYAAANAFLDALATHRRATGHRDTTSFGWSSWRGTGMAALVTGVIDAELSAAGVADVSVAEAFESWDFAWQRDLGYAAVLRPVQAAVGRPALLNELATPDTADAEDVGSEFSWDLPAEALRPRLLEEIGTQVAAEMKLAVSALDPGRSLVSLGLDSVMSLIIRNRLERRFKVKLPATLLWHRPTVDELADYLLDQRREVPT